MSESTRLDPKIRYVWMAGALVPVGILAIATLGLLIGDVPVAPYITGGIALFAGVAALTMPVLRWRSWTYTLTPTELIVRFGVLVKVERWLPRTRIQHVDIIAGPIERTLGLSQIVIYTAGTREADVTVPGLPTDDATGLRAELLSWSQVSEESVDPEETGDSEPSDDPIVPAVDGGDRWAADRVLAWEPNDTGDRAGWGDGSEWGIRPVGGEAPDAEDVVALEADAVEHQSGSDGIDDDPVDDTPSPDTPRWQQ
jgi:uncharacterized protein